jgi:hypothetical protein
MTLDLRPVAGYIRRAPTEELLDRVTVYREGMEPAAVDLMENELWHRGLTPERVAAHEAERRKAIVIGADGLVVRCAFCDRPARTKRWGWHKLFGRVPVFPRLFPRCGVHGPAAAGPPAG